MRTHTAAEASRARSASLNYHYRFEVRNPDDTGWVDISPFLLTADWGRDGDQATMDGTFEFLRETDPANSLAPRMGSSLLNRTATDAYEPLLRSMREIRFSTAITANGVAPIAGDWREVFLGIIDETDSASGDNLSLTARDIGARLLDRQFESKKNYALPSGTPLQTVLQNMLNDNGFSHVSLYTPVDPLWMVTRAEFEEGSLLDGMRSLANQIGWDVRYEYDEANVFRLTLFQPNRETTVPSMATFGPQDYETVERFVENGADVRTVVRIWYEHETGRTDSVQVEASQALLDQYGRRLFVLPVEATFNIRTNADALVLANRVLQDVSAELADQEPVMWYWPYVQVGDVYTFEANGVQYDSDQKMYVFGFRHELNAGHISTRLTVSGQPVAFYRTWDRRAEVPETLPGTKPTIQLRILSSTRTEQTVEITATNPTGGDVTLEASVGGGAFVTLGSGDNVVVGQVVLPRSPQGEDRVLLARATAEDTGAFVEVPYTADWDFLPEVVNHSLRPLLDVDGEQIGHVIDAVVDDDTQSVVVDKESGEFTILGTTVHDTSVVKTISNQILQDVGQEGVLRLRPFASAGGTGLEGKTSRVELLRSPVSSIAMRDLTVTRLEVTISANPSNALIHYRSYREGDTPPAWTFAPSPVTIEIQRHATDDIILEYYAKVAGVSPEERRRLVVDPDQSADVEVASVAVSGNRVTISANLEDEDIVRYEVYAKEGEWPTLDGLDTGKLDLACLRAANGRNEGDSSFFATNGQWYFILVGYDFAGTPGVRAFHGPETVDNTAPTTPHGTLLWANVYLNQSGGNNWHRITWGPDENITLDYEVRVYERAAIKGNQGAFTYIGSKPAPDGFLDGPNITTVGSGFFVEWTYRVELWHNVDGKIQELTTQISGYYMP